MAPKYKLFSSNSSNSNVKNDGNDGIDWAEFMMQGGTLTLALVKEASEIASFPGIREAAATALVIMKTIQDVKDNKAAWRLLADECTALIAVVWTSYQNSSDKANWPPVELRGEIQTLVITLASIQDHVKEKLSRGKVMRIAMSAADATKIAESRLQLLQTVRKFELASHLKMNSALQSLLAGQTAILQRLAANNIPVERTDTENILARIQDMTLQDREIIPQASSPPATPQSAVPAPVADPARTTMALAPTSQAATPQEDEDKLNAAAGIRYMENETRYFNGDRDAKRPREPIPTIESEDEEMYDEQDAAGGEADFPPDNEPPPPPPARNRRRTANHQVVNMTVVDTPGINGMMNINLPGLTASIPTLVPDAGWQSNNQTPSMLYPPGRQSHLRETQHTPSPPPQYSNAASYPSPHPSTPQNLQFNNMQYQSSPAPFPQYQYNPQMLQSPQHMYPSPMSPPGHFPPGPWNPLQTSYFPMAGMQTAQTIINHGNVGNVTNNQTIGSNNDYTVSYGGSKKKKKRRG